MPLSKALNPAPLIATPVILTQVGVVSIYISPSVRASIAPCPSVRPSVRFTCTVHCVNAAVMCGARIRVEHPLLLLLSQLDSPGRGEGKHTTAA